MGCPNCKDVKLESTLTTLGVLIDFCPRCEGIWLDKGEIFYFTENPNYLRFKLNNALQSKKPSSRLNPYKHTPLVELFLMGGSLVIDYCPHTEGIWLDKKELERLPFAREAKLKINIDRNVHPKVSSQPQDIPIRLPNLGLVSGVTLFALYAFLFLVLIILVEFGILTSFFALVIGISFALLQFILSPFIMDLSLRWFYKVEWTHLEKLPSHLKDFFYSVCRKNKINFPRIGIIPDGSPNAFTYGHTPNNARVILTSGIMDLLEPEELEAVVAHEVGHIVHRDILIMTVAYTVPLILYYIYRTLIRTRTRGGGKFTLYRYMLAVGCYILYIISQYIVLWFSRIREYFADRFAGDYTKDPNRLTSALVKIGYGLAGREKKKEERSPQLEAVKAMGIFDPAGAIALAIASYHPQFMGEEVDKKHLEGAMKWDLWNPWALYYELHSPHPLIAKRLLALSRQSHALGSRPYIEFDSRRPESYWDEFFVDLLMKLLPVVTIISAVILFIIQRDIFFLELGAFFLGWTCLAQTLFSYNFSYFPELNISSLLKKVKVSGIRGIPCTVKGRIIGRGIPGLIWSEDFVLQDETGIIFLDYQQPLGVWNFLFGLLRARQYIGEEAEITGWYRRMPVPYIEIRTLKVQGKGKNVCYTFNFKIIFAVFLIILGAVLVLI